MRSVNMWEKGRATDAYRGKARILGENFSLSDQLIKTNDVWNRLGYKNRPPGAGFDAWLTRLPKTTLTWFAQRRVRPRAADPSRRSPRVQPADGERRPDVSLQERLFSHPVLARACGGSPNAAYPQLLPKFSIADGAELMPLAFIRGIELTSDGVRYRQDGLDRVGTNTPVKDDRMGVDVQYEFAPGSIRRVDTYLPSAPLDVKQISLEFGSFSEAARVNGTRITFGSGEVSELNVEGLQSCQAESSIASDVYRAPHGAMKTRVSCASTSVKLQQPFTIAWTLKYR